MGPVTRLLRLLLVFALLSAMGAAILAAPGSASGARQPRVVDGTPASNSQWPFIAALVTRGMDAVDGQFCGGSVIAPILVLTAAHCVEGTGPSDIDVVTGRARLSDDGAGQRIAVSAIRVDPRYDPNTQRHDAALLVLAQPTSAPPISIAPANDRQLIAPGAPLAVAGWGDIDSAGDSPDVLHAGALKAIATRVCANAWGSTGIGALLFCAGSRRGHRTDTCGGDSGGPLISRRGITRLVGIVAFGGDVCGDPSAPGVYVRASAEAAWIIKTLTLAPVTRSRVN